MTEATVTRAGRAHAQRFLQHIATEARDLGPDLAALWAVLDRAELAEGRRQAAQLLSALVEATGLDLAAARDLMGLAYLRLQYRLHIDGAEVEILGHLASADALDARLLTAMETVEPDLLVSLTRLARRALRAPEARAEVEAALGYLRDLAPWCPTLPEADLLPAALVPADMPRAREIALGLTLPLLVALWPRKDNTPRPRTPNDVK
jgi:hypothetical protein